MAPLLFPGAELVSAGAIDPRALFGQRHLYRTPHADLRIFMHQIRPLTRGPSITFVYDTIPLRYGGSRPARWAKRRFFLLSARLSRQIITISETSKQRIMTDLRVPEERISVVRLAVDTDRATRIATRRSRVQQEQALLYVGRFDRHKNLERLCRAFVDSEFQARGGKLLLVGGWESEVEPMADWLVSQNIPGVDLRGACSEEQLDELMASSRALVLPSLEEGFGLPAFEAAASGLPVAASRTGAMPDLAPEQAALFDPTDTVAMRAAIDDATTRPLRRPWMHAVGSVAAEVRRAIQYCLIGERRSILD